MADLFGMAKKLGDALGRDTASSVESLVTGIGRQSRMMLDNLGIIVDTEKAYEDYAREINKTSSTLTDAEKKQAFMNATLTAARQKIKDLPEGISENNEAFQQFNASMSNLNESVGKAFLPLMTGLANAATALANAMSPDRVKAYAFIIGVALVGALIAYEKQLKKVIIQQSRTGWGLAATAVGFLITELTISTMFMKESAKESENLADETKKLKDEMEELANTKAAEALEKYYCL
jgi:chromosome segregation ATPase